MRYLIDLRLLVLAIVGQGEEGSDMKRNLLNETGSHAAVLINGRSLGFGTWRSGVGPRRR